MTELWERLRAIAFGGEPRSLGDQDRLDWCEGLYSSLGHLLMGLFDGMPPTQLMDSIGRPDPAVAVKPPFNRRMRRSLERSRGVLLHICSGRQKWMPVVHSGFRVLELDIESGVDLLDDSVYSYVLKLCRLGVVKGVISGPPCSTISRLRNDVDGGPRPIRGRGDHTRYGIENPTVLELESLKTSNSIWVRTVGIWLLSQATNGDTVLSK